MSHKAGDIVTLRCTVEKCKDAGERNMLLRVDDGSGAAVAINSKSEAILPKPGGFAKAKPKPSKATEETKPG